MENQTWSRDRQHGLQRESDGLGVVRLPPYLDLALIKRGGSCGKKRLDVVPSPQSVISLTSSVGSTPSRWRARFSKPGEVSFTTHECSFILGCLGLLVLLMAFVTRTH